MEKERTRWRIMKAKVNTSTENKAQWCAMQEKHSSAFKLASPEESCHSKLVFNARAVFWCTQ